MYIYIYIYISVDIYRSVVSVGHSWSLWGGFSNQHPFVRPYDMAVFLCNFT